MAEVIITSIEGRRLELSTAARRGVEQGPSSYGARLVTEHGEVECSVWDYLPGPSAFFRSLAADWQGWSGERVWASLEGEITIAARHDSKGLILCDVSLGSNIPPAWRLSAYMTFGAGAHMEDIASAVEAASL